MGLALKRSLLIRKLPVQQQKMVLQLTEVTRRKLKKQKATKRKQIKVVLKALKQLKEQTPKRFRTMMRIVEQQKRRILLINMTCQGIVKEKVRGHYWRV